MVYDQKIGKIQNGLIPWGFGSGRIFLPTNLSTDSVDIDREPRRRLMFEGPGPICEGDFGR